MKLPPIITVAAAACLCASALPVAAQQQSEFAKITGKKLIEYGWDRPSPEYTRDNIRQMEKNPFEGVIMKLPENGGAVFKPKNWQENHEKLQDQIKVLSEIKWGRFTDNFIAMYAASEMDWYSDEDWKSILENVQFVAKAGKAANVVGLMWDPEPYGNNPWKYSQQKHAKKYSYTEYSQKVHERGRQFMEAIQSELPKTKVLTLHEYTMLYNASNNPKNGDDPTLLKKAFQSHNYGLLLPFLNGMLEAANPGTQLIDGNESSYYYTSPHDFEESYRQMRHDDSVNVPSSLKAKFEEHHRAGQALYPDHLYALRPKKYESSYMNNEQQNKWFEQNVYYALKYSDEYVWLYGQHMNWWTGKDLPKGILDSINSAKTKLKNGQPLGFDTAEIFNAARANRLSFLKDLKAPAEGAPRVDNEDIYTRSTFTFLQYAKKGDQITLNVKAKRVYPRETHVELHDPAGKLLETYTIPYDDKPVAITFTAEETGIYQLARTQSFSQRVDVNSSHPGNGYAIEGNMDFLPQTAGKFYFEVPAGVKEFSLGVMCPDKKNHADVALVDPSGKVVQQEKIDESGREYKFSGKRADASQSEIWAIDVSDVNWAVRLMFSEPLSPIVSTNPATLLLKK